MSDSADGKPVVLVTGASAGIGEATARFLARSGYRVFGTARRPDVTAESPTRDGVEMLPLEVTSDASVEACVAEVSARTGGRVDVLLNNVGTGILGAAEEATIEQARWLFDVNFFGAVRVTDAVLPLMRARRAGRVLFMSSAGGMAGVPFAAFYCATKHALEGYAESLRHELRPLGLGVSVIAPGAVSTAAGDKAARAERRIADYDAKRDELTARFVESIRGGMNPEVVAKAVLGAIRDRRPRERYEVGAQAWGVTLLKAALPRWAFDGLVRRMTGAG